LETLEQRQAVATESALAVNDITVALNDRVQACDNIFSAQLDMISKHNESAKNILELFATFFAAFTETNANVEKNSEKLDAFILKMESYFGSGKGLEYDN
jgi:hypothetical protein